MAVGDSSRSQARVLIAGGGFAGVEAALALRALAGENLRLTLISPDSVLRYRPAAPLDAFETGAPRSYELRAIAAHVGAEYHTARLESVASRRRYVRTASGLRLEYDELVLATGSRPVTGVAGALTFRDQRDTNLIRPLLEELLAGTARRVVFAAPSGYSWPLPLYELALLSAMRAHERGVEPELSIVSPEREPLAVFGAEASRLVGDLLDERGVRFVGATVPIGFRRDGSLVLRSDGAIKADRVVAVPELRGRRITGVPSNLSGFVPVDSSGRVEGLAGVYAAGDMTTFPIKQGGLATQQADRIAHTIAASLGAPVKQLRPSHVLRAHLVGGKQPLVLRTDLDWQGRPTGAAIEQARASNAADSTKVFGRYLAPYLEQL